MKPREVKSLTSQEVRVDSRQLPLDAAVVTPKCHVMPRLGRGQQGSLGLESGRSMTPETGNTFRVVTCPSGVSNGGNWVWGDPGAYIRARLRHLCGELASDSRPAGYGPGAQVPC